MIDKSFATGNFSVLEEGDPDPALILGGRGGFVAPGFTSDNDTVSGALSTGPISFYVPGSGEAGDTGRDTIREFGRGDILVLDQALFDRNDDGIITFGRKGLKLDGPDTADSDTINFVDGLRGATGLRVLGDDGLGHYAYADARTRPLDAIEGKLLTGDTLTGTTGQSDKFFYDNALDVNWGNDTIQNFGANDYLVTTTKMFDLDNDGRIKFGQDRNLDLTGFANEDPGQSSAYGSIAFTNEKGNAITSLYLVNETVHDGVTYYAYSSAKVAPPPNYDWLG
jgi:hypothetical protein